MNVLGNGWRDSDICQIDTGALIFTGDGFVVNDITKHYNKNNTVVEADFGWEGVDIGLVLWYNEGIGHIRFVLTSTGFSVIRSYKGNDIVLKHVLATDINYMPELGAVALKAELFRTNIKCYLGTTLVFNLEQSTYIEGLFGVYGATGASCASFTVQCNSTAGWTKSLFPGCHIAIENEQVTFLNQNTLGDSHYIEQSTTLVIGKTYTLSCLYQGSMDIRILNGGDQSLLDSTTVLSAELAPMSLTFAAANTDTVIQIGTGVVGTLVFTTPQLEQKTFATSYVEVDRDRATLSFPANKVDKENGALALWFSMTHDYTSGTLPIFYYNDSFKIWYTAGSLWFKYGTFIQECTIELDANKPYHIIAYWKNGNVCGINLLTDAGTEDESDTHIEVPVSLMTIPYSDTLMIGCDGTISGNVVIDTIVIYAGQTNVSDMVIYRTEPIHEDNRIAVKTDFTNDTLVFSKNKITVPVPKPNTPVIVQDDNDVTYDRVYYINNGQYVLYNTKSFTYTDSKSITVEYDSFVKLEAYSGTKIFTNVTNTGNVITVNDLTDSDEGQMITVSYMPRNVFYARYNTSMKGYEIEISNTDGRPITITYEDVLGEDSTLVDTIEANPFKATNNNGFVYVIGNPLSLLSLDIKATPEAVIADGYQIVTISVDCIAEDGTPTGNVELVIDALKYGTISRYFSADEQALIDAYNIEKDLHGEEAAVAMYGNIVTDEARSGRYIYKYRVNNITGSSTLTERIIITDKKSGIGTEIPIKIVSK